MTHIQQPDKINMTKHSSMQPWHIYSNHKLPHRHHETNQQQATMTNMKNKSQVDMNKYGKSTAGQLDTYERHKSTQTS